MLAEIQLYCNINDKFMLRVQERFYVVELLFLRPYSTDRQVPPEGGTPPVEKLSSNDCRKFRHYLPNK